MNGIATKCKFSFRAYCRIPLVFLKVMKVSLPNLNDKNFRSKKSTKKLVGVALLLPIFPHSWTWPFGHFWPFLTIQTQGIEQTTTILFILKVLWCSNNLMQKMTSMTLSIYEIIHLKVFFKNFAHKFPPISRF